MPAHIQVKSVLAFCSFLVVVYGAAASDVAGLVEPLLDAETIGVAKIDWHSCQVEPVLAAIAEIAPDMESQLEPWSKAFKTIRDELTGAGFPEAIAVVRLHKLLGEQSVILLPKTPQSDVARLERFIEQSSPMVVEDRGSAVLIGHREVIDGLASAPHEGRPGLNDAFAAVGGDAISIIVSLSADHRRTLDELLPTLPPQLGGEPSTAITRGLQWLAVGINFQRDRGLEFVIQSADEAAAKSLLRAWHAGLSTLAAENSVSSAPSNVGATASLIEFMTPRQEGSRLSLTLGGEQDAQHAWNAAAPAIRALRIQSLRKQSTSNLKQLALAILNFESANRSLPAVGSYDDAGRPLLSWRVHVLPYLDASDLYKRFHLDEPWDSPHNKALLPLMPEVFRCPGSIYPASSGLATFREVVGEHTVWPGREGVKYKDIVDGASQTILLVEVDDDHAVAWSKPEGLPFDPNGPPVGLGKRFPPGGFVMTFCDGGAHYIALPEQADMIVPLLTRDGKEVVKW